MDYEFEVLGRDICYQGFFRLERCRLRHSLFEGGSQTIERELFERGHAAAAVLYDPGLDRLVMVEQFRVGAIASERPWLLEFVAGIIEPGEAPEDVVRRESVEEAGCTVAEVEAIGEFILSPGGCSERIYLFCGRVDARGAGGVHGVRDEGEDIRVVTVAADEVAVLIGRGEATSATTLIGLQWFLLNREPLRARWL